VDETLTKFGMIGGNPLEESKLIHALQERYYAACTWPPLYVKSTHNAAPSTNFYEYQTCLFLLENLLQPHDYWKPANRILDKEPRVRISG
jgi:hypothetical protein